MRSKIAIGSALSSVLVISVFFLYKKSTEKKMTPIRSYSGKIDKKINGIQDDSSSNLKNVLLPQEEYVQEIIVYFPKKQKRSSDSLNSAQVIKLPAVLEKKVIIKPVDESKKSEPIESEPIVGSIKENKEELLKTEEISQPTFPDLENYVKRRAKYPISAENTGIQGQVIVLTTINEEGKAVNPIIKKSLRSDFDKAAIALIKKMPNWNPATKNGQSVPVEVEIPIKFLFD
jgi:TonB family protein